MRILVLHQHYWPELAATAQLLTDLCEDLARAGHEVHVICGQPSYHADVQGRRSLPARDVHHAVRIHRVWSFRPKRRSIPRRMGHYGTYFLTSTLAALRIAKPDVALVLSTPPLLLGLSGSLLRLLREVPFVYSVQDVYPDIARDLGVIPDGKLFQGIDAISRFLYQRAAKIVTLSAGMASALAAKGIASEAIEVISNWADTETLRPIEGSNLLRAELGIDDRFCVLYSGNIGLSQGLESVIEAASLLIDQPVQFVFAGQGNAAESLQKQSESLLLSNVLFVPTQPRERLSELLSLADVGLVPMKRGLSRDLVPSKLYGLMAAGRPILACVEEQSEVARVLEAHGCGIVLPPENPSALASEIQRIFPLKDSLSEMGHNARKAAEAHYSRKQCTERYLKVLMEAYTVS